MLKKNSYAYLSTNESITLNKYLHFTDECIEMIMKHEIKRNKKKNVSLSSKKVSEQMNPKFWIQNENFYKSNDSLEYFKLSSNIYLSLNFLLLLLPK